MIEFQRPAVTAPDGCIVGVLLESGELAGNSEGILRFPFCNQNAIARARGISKLLEERRAGKTFVLISHDEPLLESCADEVWWIRDGELIARGDPAEVLPKYRRHVARELRAAGEGVRAALAPSIRNGDGRATLEAIELAGENGQSAIVFRSGEPMSIRVSVKYGAVVQDPVIGILIRTRIGLNVYGTNTELEHMHPGPVAGGDTLRITYSFRCELCPGDYTVTAASHDPDGVWHDWQEDAVAFAVSDSRYTAGVANLRAQVSVEHQRQSASV